MMNGKKRISTRAICAIILVTLTITSLFAAGCSSGAEYVSDAFISMDTLIEIKLDPSTPDIKGVMERCREITETARLRYDADDAEGESDICRFNASADGCRVSPEVGKLYELSYSIYTATDGAFNVALRPVIELWRRAETAGVLPDADELRALTESADPSKISYDPVSGIMSKAPDASETSKTNGLAIDLGGIGKGDAEAAVIEYLKASGARYGVVSFGGNISVFGEKPGGSPFSVALRDPQSPTKTVGNIRLSTGFVSVSGDYERYYEIDGKHYGHILDPATGHPSDSGLCSVAVICADGAVADALSTAIFVMGYERGMELYGSLPYAFEAIFILPGEIYTTSGIAEDFTLTSSDYMKR